MTTLICTGTLFSNWQHVAGLNFLSDTKHTSARTELSKLSKKICRQQFDDIDELEWKPFTPHRELSVPASQIISKVRNDSFFAWADASCGLCLDFWQSAIDDARVVLFYSSPEYELCNYINAHALNESSVGAVMQSWLIRTRAMLAFFMRNRSRCLMLNVESAGSQQPLFLQTLNQHFKLALENKPSTTTERPANNALVKYLATSLLLGNELVSELYDEVRSAATVISEQDKAMPDIQSRSNSLIHTFLEEAESYRQLIRSHEELEEDLMLKKFQINQVTEELEYYYKSSRDQGQVFANYLNTDPLLSIARQARQSE